MPDLTTSSDIDAFMGAADNAAARTSLGLTALASTTPGTNVATFLATPSSANLAAALTDETGTGAAVFANSPTLVTPSLGTPSSGTLTNCTGLLLSGIAQSSATSGQVPTWNGSAWAAATPAGGDAPIYGQLAANYTLTSTTATQKLFDWSTNGAVSLPTGRYRFSMMAVITSMSATGGNGTFSLLGAGSATVANVLYQAVGADNNAPLISGQRNGSGSQTETAPGTLMAAATGTGMLAEITGFFNITVTGTIIPSIALTTAAAAVVEAGSYFECVRLGPTGSNTQGTWT